MGTTLTQFQTRLRGPLGRNDATADGFITQGVNFGCVLVALLFSPPELETSGSLVISAGGTSVSLSTLTRLRLLQTIYNSTLGRQIFSVDPDRLDYVVPTGAGSVQFYSRRNSTLHTRPTPAVQNNLIAYYTQFPLVVSTGTDAISIDNYDSLIETYALAYAQGCLDEIETAAFWQKLGETLLVPEQVMSQARTYLEGGPSGYNTSRAKA